MLGGSVGSFTGLVGVFGMFWLTRRHERRLEAQRREDAARQLREERLAASVVTAIRHFTKVPWTGASADVSAWSDQGVAELAVLEVLSAPDHMELSHWAGGAVMELIEAVYQDEAQEDERPSPSGAPRVMDRAQEVADDVNRKLRQWVVGRYRVSGGRATP